MKTHIFSLCLLTVVTLMACQNSNAPEAIEEETAVSATNSTVVEGLPLSFTAPNELTNATPNTAFNGQLGRYEVQLNDDLMFVISEEEQSIEDLKQELREDQLFSYKFYDEGTNALLYQAVLPDGSDYLYQYARTMKVGDKNFLIHTDKNGEYSLQHIQTLKAAMNSIVPV